MKNENIDNASLNNHPLVHDVNKEQSESLTGVEKICKKISDSTGAPLALALAIIVQLAWVAIGQTTGKDAYPFPFLLTCSNILQLILIFILAVGQKQSASHAERRAEHDHDAISRLLYHQELQEDILIRLATQTNLKMDDIVVRVNRLAVQDGAPDGTTD